jgi:hypothetical protein
MEPQKSDKSVESPGEVQNSPARKPERKRRFQIVRLEERIAPRDNKNTNNGCGHGQCFCGH